MYQLFTIKSPDNELLTSVTVNEAPAMRALLHERFGLVVDGAAAEAVLAVALAATAGAARQSLARSSSSVMSTSSFSEQEIGVESV